MSEIVTQLLQAALHDLHVSWVPELDMSLLTKAKASDFGRRWLASQLARLELFSAPPCALDIPASLLQTGEWWQSSISDNCELLIGLGAYRCIPMIRRAILREQVLQWRRVLGYSLYRQLLHVPIKNHESSGQKDVANELLLEWHDDASLVQCLRRLAYGELLCFASCHHVLLAQRVALAFPQSWWQAYQNDPPTQMLAQTTFYEVVAQCGLNKN